MYQINTLDVLKSMAHNAIHNYIVPGLTSYMLADSGKAGKVRMFHSTRDQAHEITPHSHRFNFTCLVLEGEVRNRLWTSDPDGDMFWVREMELTKEFGYYDFTEGYSNAYSFRDKTYVEGDWYSMAAEDIHSISFSKGARVLFFEGPELYLTSTVIEPFVRGQRISILKSAPWMFIKE